MMEGLFVMETIEGSCSYKNFAVLDEMPNICNIELPSHDEAPMFDKICRSVAEAFNIITGAR